MVVVVVEVVVVVTLVVVVVAQPVGAQASQQLGTLPAQPPASRHCAMLPRTLHLEPFAVVRQQVTAPGRPQVDRLSQRLRPTSLPASGCLSSSNVGRTPRMDLGSDVLPLVSGTDETFKREIAAYYDATQVLYSHVWSPTGVHYGFWEADTTRHGEAIRNMDRTVAAGLALRPGARVLDAGCGIGGTSIFLAEAYGVDVVGITLSEDQLRRARRAATTCAASERPTFRIGDYLSTGFPEESFDGVFAIESVCYAKDKWDFMHEAFRVLRPGGRRVVADGFIGKPMTARDVRRYRHFVEGLALDNLATVQQFETSLAAVGFVHVRRQDKHEAVRRSARRIWRLSLVGVAVCGIGCRLGLLPDAWLGHGLAGVAQWPLFRSGVFTYCVFTATKPRSTRHLAGA